MKAPAALTRHIRFYIALVCGVVAWAACRQFEVDAALLAGGDVFYLAFLLACIPVIGQKPAALKKRAKSQDEGIVVVVFVTLATAVFFMVAVFMALNKKQGIEVLPLALAAIGAPLGWFVLHTVMAFHYANIHYFDDPECVGDEKDLDFPGRKEPGPWDFLYFSFVIGMTAQVSDIEVRTSMMRRAVLLHGIASFFFNTVFIAMAVNAGVALAS